nr:ulp1 protease family, C-terminal catalytic domain-containing protein [Tanacetum cinerariifolium]
MDANIHSDVHVEEQNSPVIDKEYLLAVFDGIKATVHITDKRKREVATSCLVKELDLVKDRIVVIEKALKLRYQESSEDSVQQLCYKQHELGGSKNVSAVSDVFHQVVASETHHCPGEGLGFIYANSQDQFSVSQLLQVATNEKYGPVVDCTQLEGSVGFDNVLDPGCKDEFGYDNDQEGLVKVIDDLCIEEHISGNVVDAKVVDEKVLDDKVLDEKVLDAKVVDEKGQAISRLTTTEDQQPPSDHQVHAGVGVDVHVDDVQLDADWAIAGLYFCPLVMGKDVPFWPANGVKYPVPWTEVDRVFIPINQPKKHYCLAVLHIMAELITLYDNLGVLPIKKRKWWKKIRLTFKNVIPTYLDECGVLKAKCISFETYKIKFEVVDNVPTQGDAYEDCGVWVCIFLHRLCQNLPISTDHALVHVGLAYREHMVEYLWKYRLPEQRFKSIGNFN